MPRRPAPPSGRPALELLDEFVVACDELAATRLIQQGFETGLVMRGGPGITVTTPMPDEDDFRSMLMALRPLITDGEETSFNRVFNLLERCLTDPQLIDAARRSRGVLNDARRGSTFRLASHTPEELADLFLSGRYFHRDPEKREALDAVSDPEMAKLLRYFLNQFALEAVRQAAAVSNIIRRAKAEGSLRGRPQLDHSRS